jgi:two-component system, OmpR family, sensor kinase
VWRHGLPGSRVIGWRGSRAIARLPAWPSLQVRLVAAVLCLVAAAGVAITAAGCLTVRGYLMRQADQQLRSYAVALASHPFSVFPAAPLAPGVPGLGAPGGLGGPGGSGDGTVSVEIRDSVGGPVMSAGPAPGTVGGGNWLAIAEPVHYQYRHIPFVYGAQDSSLAVTGLGRPGLSGTLVVRLSVASIGRAAGRLAATGLAVTGVVLLLVGGLAAVVVRAILRPLTRMERTAAAAAADRAGQALSAAAAAEASARGSAERTGRAIADTAGQLRRPVQVLHAIAGYFPQRSRLAPDQPDRLMGQVADEAARIEVLIHDLLRLRPQGAHQRDRPD